MIARGWELLRYVAVAHVRGRESLHSDANI